MPKEIKYPTPEEIIEYNQLVIQKIQVKKADSSKVLSVSKIRNVIEML